MYKIVFLNEKDEKGEEAIVEARDGSFRGIDYKSNKAFLKYKDKKMRISISSA